MIKIGKKKIESSSVYSLFFTILFVAILIQYSFTKLEAIFYDLRIRSDISLFHEKKMVLVVMDEESDEFLGESFPYTYATHQRLMSRLGQSGAKVITYLVPFKEPELNVDREYLNQFKTAVKEFERAGGKFRIGTDMDVSGEQLPPKELQELGYSLALLNKDNASFSKDDVIRRTILNISGEDSFHLWVANTFSSLNHGPKVEAKKLRGAYYSRDADATFTLFRYRSNPLVLSSEDKIPFHRVLVGNYPANYFKDKIVLIGPAYLSNPGDFALTPFNKEEGEAPKLAVHALIISSLLEGKTILEVPSAVTGVLALILAIYLAMVILIVHPSRGLIITVGTFVSVMVISYLFFVIFGIWIQMAHLILSIFAVYYILIPFKAIAEYKRRYAIQEETRILKQVDHLKQNFISLMSHDLKTPVAKIAGVAEILYNKYNNSEEQKKSLEFIKDATKELNKFITSILDLTKIESSNLGLKKTSRDVNTLIELVVESLRFEAARNSIKIECNLAPLYPISVDTDLMKRVFSNLIENSIKYSGKNAQINVRTWDDKQWVYIEITDTGPGIAESDLAHIFDKFYRVKNDASHQIKGSGLGLYLVKYFVELHQGSISVKSKVGEGTSFQIQLKNV